MLGSEPNRDGVNLVKFEQRGGEQDRGAGFQYRASSLEDSRKRFANFHCALIDCKSLLAFSTNTPWFKSNPNIRYSELLKIIRRQLNVTNRLFNYSVVTKLLTWRFPANIMTAACAKGCIFRRRAELRLDGFFCNLGESLHCYLALTAACK